MQIHGNPTATALSKDIAIIVHSYNEKTGNISGQPVENFLKDNKENWCLDKFNLNGNLPLDILEVVEVAKVFENKKKDVVLEITGVRYCKNKQDMQTLEKLLFPIFSRSRSFQFGI